MKKTPQNELIIKILDEIPTLPTVVTRILNIVLDDKSSVKDISEVVRVDQALTSKVLRVVNSAAYGLREKVSTVEHAMTILGFDTLKKLFLCLSIFDNLSQENQTGHLFQKAQFWCHSLAVATVARGIARLIKYPSPDEAYVAGLLHDVGKIIIEQATAEKYHDYLKKINLNPDLSLAFEEENLSVNHASVGKLALEKWNFPLGLQKAVALHHGTGREFPGQGDGGTGELGDKGNSLPLRFESRQGGFESISKGGHGEQQPARVAQGATVAMQHGTEGGGGEQPAHVAMGAHGAMDALAAIISVADFICWTQALGSFNFFLQPTLNPQAEKIVNLHELKLEPLLEEMNKEIALNAKIFNLQINDLKGFREALQRANLELGKINSLYDDTRKRLENYVHELNTLNEIIYKARETLEPSQVIQNVLQGVGQGFGFPRLMWFSVDAMKKRITPTATYGEFPGNLPITTVGCGFDEEICLPLSACIQDKNIIHLRRDRVEGEIVKGEGGEGEGEGETGRGPLGSQSYCPVGQQAGSPVGQQSGSPLVSPPLSHSSICCLLKSLQSDELLLVPIGNDQGAPQDRVKKPGHSSHLLLIDNQGENVHISSDTIKVIEILSMNLGMALENAELFQSTAQMAIIDSLTEIYNRRQLDSSLKNEVNRAARFQQPFSIALFDIDHFKMVNDTYGHQVGDIILKDVSAVIKSNSRNTDIVGRFGGDEFLVILPNTQMQGGMIFVERVRLIVEKYGLFRQKSFPHCQITLSIGLAEFNNSLDNAERLLHKADRALYQSKQKGRNRVSTFKEQG